jgi:hypothetical protein
LHPQDAVTEGIADRFRAVSGGGCFAVKGTDVDQGLEWRRVDDAISALSAIRKYGNVVRSSIARPTSNRIGEWLIVNRTYVKWTVRGREGLKSTN